MPAQPTALDELGSRPGDVIAGRYVLQRKLGEGGMGIVWVARSLALDVNVALKMLRRELAGTDAVERMAREARTAAQLGHPAMVRVLDFGTSERGEPFLAMELLQGDEVHAILEREQRIPATRAVGLLLPVIDGLATAHDKGIVHRDIKPENIFIARDDQGRIQPKVLDFGIAKLDRGPAIARLTQMGAVLGSPQYLSPEQAEGRDDIDFHTDIWSIGVLLYEIVTGKQPFEGKNYNALIRSITHDTPKPITELAAGDGELWMIIARCLEKKPTDRYGSMWELGRALAAWLFERGVRVDAASRSLRDGWLQADVTGLAVMLDSVAPPPDLPASAGRGRAPAELVATGVRATEAPPPRSQGRRVAAGVVGAVVVLGVLVAFLFRHPVAGSEPGARRAQAAGSEDRPPQVLPPVLAAPAIPAQPPAPAAPGSARPGPVAETPSSGTGASESGAPPASGALAARPPPATKRSTKASAPRPPVAGSPSPRRHGVDTEFGF